MTYITFVKIWNFSLTKSFMDGPFLYCNTETESQHLNRLSKFLLLCVLQCDQTMKAVTVSYFSLQHALTSPVPTQFQTLCESSRLYEPGSQFMEYVKRMPEPMAGAQDRSVMSDPFHFEPYTLDAAARSASESAASGGETTIY